MISEAVTDLTAKNEELQSTITPTILEMENRLANLALEFATMNTEAKSVQQVEMESPRDKKSAKVGKNVSESEVERQIKRVQEDIEKSLADLRLKTEGKIYEIENKTEELQQKVDDLCGALEDPSAPRPTKSGATFSGKPIKEDVATDLYQRYNLLNQELIECKQLVAGGYASKSGGLENAESLEKRIESLEKEHDLIVQMSRDHKDNYDLLTGGLLTVQKSIWEKLKVKIIIPGITDDKDTDKVPNFAKEPKTGLGAAVAPSPRLSSMQLPASQAADLLVYERKFAEIYKELGKYATKGDVERVEQNVKVVVNALGTKCEKKDVERATNNLSIALRSAEDRVKELSLSSTLLEKKVENEQIRGDSLGKLLEEDGAKVYRKYDTPLD